MRRKSGNVEHLLAGMSIGLIFGLTIGVLNAAGYQKTQVERANAAWERCEYVVPKGGLEDAGPSEWRDMTTTPTGDRWCITTRKP